MKFKAFISELIKTSAILGALDRLSAFLYKQLSESFFGKLFTSYGALENKRKRGLFASLFKKDKRKKMLARVRYAIARAFERSSLLAFVSGLFEYFLGCRLKVYGLFLLPFGIYTSLIYVVKKYAFYLETENVDILYFGIAMLVISLLLIPSSQTLAEALESSRIMKYILSDTLGIRMENISKKRAKKGGSSVLFFVLGVVAGILTLFVSPFAMLGFIITLVVLGLVFSYPEAGVLVLVFISPFAVFVPYLTGFLVAAVLATMLSYMIKLVRGKRTFSFELVDFAVALFSVLILFGGIASAAPTESVKTGITLVCLMLIYFLTVNLMRTKLWLKRVISVLTAAATAVSLYGIWLYRGVEANAVSGRMASPFLLAEYIIMVIPFAFAVFLHSHKAGTKIVYFVSAVSMILCLVYAHSRSAWIGMIVGLLVFLLIYSRHTLYYVGIAAAVISFVSFMLPYGVVQRIINVLSISTYTESFRAHAKESLTRTMGDFLPELGVIGLILFALVLFFFLQNAFEYTKNTSDKRSKLMCAAGLSSVISVLVQGALDRILHDYHVFFVFWVAIALVCAYRRVGCEEESETRVMAEEDLAQIDIKMSGRSQ